MTRDLGPLKHLILGAAALILCQCILTAAETTAQKIPNSSAEVQFEARMVADEPHEGWIPAENLNGMAIYLSPEPTLTNADIARAWYEPGGPEPSIGLFLTEEGALKFAALTKANVGRKVALVLNGRVASAPVIRAPITAGRARITGNFSEEEARAIAHSLNPE